MLNFGKAEPPPCFFIYISFVFADTILKNGGSKMDFLKRAEELFDETRTHRRYLHQNAESGFELKKTVNYIKNQLEKIGIEYKDCGGGVIADIGSGEKSILLRADADALPMAEKSGLEFSSKTGCAHTCGHDLHTAMLLTAAKILKENENSLGGKVRLMFQPAEELLKGAKAMIDDGALNPRPDAAFSLHVAAGDCEVGTVLYNAGGVMMRACENFRIVINGKGGHGAYPDLCVNPLDSAIKLYLKIASLCDRGISSTVCKILGGSTYNVIPERAELEGAIRADDDEKTENAVEELMRYIDITSKASDVSIDFETISEAFCLVCDKAFSEFVVGICRERGYSVIGNMSADASEDFSYVAKEIPSAMIYLGAGFRGQKGQAVAHDPKVIFNEEVLLIGSSLFSEVAYRWLNE